MKVIRKSAPYPPMNTQSLEYFVAKTAEIMNVLSPISVTRMDMKEPTSAPCSRRSSRSSSSSLLFSLSVVSTSESAVSVSARRVSF